MGDSIERSIELENQIEFRSPNVSHVDGLAYVARIAIERGGAPAQLLEAFLRDLRAGELQLPVLPDSVSRVMPLIGDPEVDLGDLATLVELDPVLAVKTVGVANSAYYCGAERAESVRDALMRMGLRQARNIVLAVALRSSVFKVPGYETQAQAVWFHSLFTAFAVEALLAKIAPWESKGFLLGLSHDVGRIALLQFAAQERKRAPDAPHVLPAIVSEVSDLLHEKLGAFAMKSWDFSDEFVHVVAHHHHPEAVRGEGVVLAHALVAGDRFADWLEGGGAAGDAVMTPDLVELLEALDIDENQAQQLVCDVHARFESLANLL